MNLIFNNQRRPDFDRRLVNTSLGYSFINKKINTNEFVILPVDVSFIQIDKTPAFQARLDSLRNPLLNATYDNQFILGLRVLETWTDRQTVNQKHYRLNRAQFELAGNILGLLANIFDAPIQTDTNSNSTETDEYRVIGGVRYAQFIKLQNDWSYNTRLKYNQIMSYRILGGIGLAYGNAISLPYDRSFYGGGANDNRGWRARTLGPGSLPDNSDIKRGVDQVADIKIHLTAEYRFNIFRSLEGALFADGGNIWFRPTTENSPSYDPDRELAYFKPNEFYKEIALTAGAGLRINFGFLLVRFDWGFKMYDPGYRKLGPNQDQNHAWLWDRFEVRNQDWNQTDANPLNPSNFSTFNLGIGYPF